MIFVTEISVSRLELEQTVKAATRQIVKDFVKDVPEELKALIDSPPPSAEGNPPAKRSGTLQRTLRAYVVGPLEIELEFEGYVRHLDPIFEEANYDRPFIKRGIAKTLAEL